MKFTIGELNCKKTDAAYNKNCVCLQASNGHLSIQEALINYSTHLEAQHNITHDVEDDHS